MSDSQGAKVVLLAAHGHRGSHRLCIGLHRFVSVDAPASLLRGLACPLHCECAMTRTSFAAWVATTVLGVSGCSSTSSSSVDGHGPDAAASPSCLDALDASLDIDAVMGRVAEIDGFTADEGGTREAGSMGYAAAAAYVRRELEDAGFRTGESTFPLDVLELDAPPELATVGVTDEAHREGVDFELAHNTGVGSVEAPVTFVDVQLGRTSTGDGCGFSRWDGFPTGNVALIRRGCPLAGQLLLASLHGAEAIIVANDASGLFHTGVRDTAEMPLLLVSEALGLELAGGNVVVRLEISGTYTTRDEPSVVAELGPGDGDVVMLGAHLDSVPEGPGINDNATGVAAVLEIAVRVADCDPTSALRVAVWGGEEIGLLGSAAYVASLDADELERLRGYVNLDMIGSPNFVPFVGDGDGSTSDVDISPGSAELEALLASYLAEHETGSDESELELRSDYAAFLQAGVPMAHLFAGAEKMKTDEQAAIWGGEAGAPFDACYHQGCDGLVNVDRDAVRMLARAAAHAVAHLVGRAR